jgi:glycosyltransferase involved in cell wall biosynthesis
VGTDGIEGSGSPLVSVVIPAFNAQDTINYTLLSVRRQSYRNLEIIVVDDGSTDGTPTLVLAHADDDRRVRLLRQQNSGVAAARNTGWQAAHSDLIAFVDADDLWAWNKIEKQLSVLLAAGERMGLVYTWWVGIDQDNRIRFCVDSPMVGGDVLARIRLGNFVGHGSSPLIRRQALIGAGGFDSALRAAGAHGCEDMLLYYRIAMRYTFGLVPEYLTGYRVVSGRMSSDRARMLRSFELVAEEMRRDCPEHRRKIDRGVRRYVVFLIGEAAGALDLRQASSILHSWTRDHPFDLIRMPFEVLWSKIRWRLNWVSRAIRLGSVRNLNPVFSMDDNDGADQR